MSSKRPANKVACGWMILAGITTAACNEELDRDGSAEPFRATAQALSLEEHTEVCQQDPRVQLGIVTLQACVGAELFFREPFGGNGRTCGTCHAAENNFTIDPAFIATLPANDPLFIAEQVPALAQLEKPQLLRDFGLILENIDGFAVPTQRFVMRSVPHMFSMGTSVTAELSPTDGTSRPPNQRTGWSGDGAPNAGELRDFQTGAVTQHYTRTLNRVPGVDFVLPTSDELDRILAFVSTIGRTNEISLTNLALSDASADSGRIDFINGRCNFCHNNAGANVGPAPLTNRNFNTGVERLRLASLNTQGIPFDGGFGGQNAASFNFDADGDTVPDSFGNGTFNTPPLIEAADTGPFFHTNAFTTIEDAVAFFNTSTFNNSPAGLAGAPVALTTTQIANIGRFLRVLNAAFNIQLAVARINGALPVITEFRNQSRALQQQLLALALAEVDDAIEVLSAVPNLNSASQTALATARSALQTASTHASHTQRRNAASNALSALTSANASLSATTQGQSALSFVMGEGSLLF